MARAQLTAAQVADLTAAQVADLSDVRRAASQGAREGLAAAAKLRPMLGGLIEVKATRPPFVDQVEAVTIGGKFQPVKWHPWLQAQIDAGFLVQK